VTRIICAFSIHHLDGISWYIDQLYIKIYMGIVLSKMGYALFWAGCRRFYRDNNFGDVHIANFSTTDAAAELPIVADHIIYCRCSSGPAATVQNR
jgi:hypothetical protein